MKTADLIEKRNAMIAEMRQAHEQDATERFEELEKELRGLDDRLERARKLDAMDAAAQPADPHFERELRGYSLARAIAWAAGIPGIDAGREREVDAELRSTSDRSFNGVAVPTSIFEQRTITSTLPAPGPGGKIIPTDYMAGEYINALTASTVVASLGARTLSGLTGNVTIPGEKAAPSVAWVAENSGLSATDAQFREIGLTPKHLGSLSEFSRNMLLQSSPDIEALLRRMMARDIALEIDRAAINGAGNGPTGLLATSDVQSATYATSIFHTTAEMIGKADAENVGASRRFLTTNKVKELCLTAQDDSGKPLPLSAIFHDVETTFSNQAPSNLGAGNDESALIYGDWSEMLIGVWSALDVLVNPYEESAYMKGNVMVRSMATVDMAVRHPKAFVKAQVKTSTADAIVSPN